MNITFTQENSARNETRKASLDWICNNSKLSERDKEAYSAGFEQGWAAFRSFAKLHGLKINMMK